MDKSEREVRRHLKELTQNVAVALARIDAVMDQPESNERGEMIAAIVNDLELANDSAMRFGLGMSFPAVDRKSVV